MIVLFWDMAFFFGAIGGAFHSPIIEANKDFFMRLIMYGCAFMVGLLLYLFASSQCELGDCKAHPIKVGSYLCGAFFMGLGGTGFMVNFAQRGTQHDVDMQMPGQQGNNSYAMAMQASSQQYDAQNYEPVTMPQGPML